VGNQTDRLELLLRVRGDVEQSVTGSKSPRRAGGEIVVTERHGCLADDEKIRNGPPHRRQRRFQHRDVDEVSVFALAIRQCGRDRERGGDAANGVGDGIADAQRRRLRTACDAHHAGHALDDLIVRGQVAQRSILPEAGDGAVDQSRIVTAQRIEAKPEPIHDAGSEILDDDGRGAHQPSQDLLAARMLEVERYRALACILGEKRHAHQVAVECGIRAELPREISCRRNPDLDDIRAQMSELVTAEWSGKDVREIEYANTCQGLGLGAAHDTSLTFLKAGMSALLERETAARQWFAGMLSSRTQRSLKKSIARGTCQASAQNSNAGLARPAGRPYSRQEGRIHRWQRSMC
jgi:hypothetical protein